MHGDAEELRRFKNALVPIVAGPLTKKRMETIDDETTAAAKDFIRRQHDAGKPFFVWMNTTHMHALTHTKPASVGQAGTMAVAVPRHDDRPRQECR